MNNAELIKVLRCELYGDDECDRFDCPIWSSLGCRNGIANRAAADAIEASEKRIEELKKGYSWKAYAALEESIEGYKTRIAELEAQMPKEGEWIHEDLDNFRKYKVTCPHCGAWYIGNYDAYDEPSDFNYCPHCGNICNPANLAWEKELSERERKEQTDETD